MHAALPYTISTLRYNLDILLLLSLEEVRFCVSISENVYIINKCSNINPHKKQKASHKEYTIPSAQEIPHCNL
jgi:hypothetical protein